MYVALGVNLEGHKELLGLWLADTEGAKFWLSVLTELRNRGVEDILIACVDGLKGFPEAIASEYPQTQVQLCIVHMVRNSLRYVTWKDYKAVSAELKTIYQASTEELAVQQLDSLEKGWGEQYPRIIKSWRDARQLGKRSDAVPVPARYSQGDLHNQCYRIVEQCYS